MLTVLIPHYNKNIDGIDGVLGDCVYSFAGKSAELIVLTDNNLSQYKKLNIGMAMSGQPYVLITNNDTKYISGDLNDMCVPNTVTRPLLDGSPSRGFGHCFCIPRAVWQLIGKFDDSYEHGYFDDNDLVFTLEKHSIPINVVKTVNIHHPEHGGTTLQRIEGIGEASSRNSDYFISKWGRLP